MERGSLSIVGSIIFVLLVTASALFGFRAMALLSSITIIPMLLLFIYAAIQGVIEGGGWSSIVTFTPEEPISLAQGITATIGIFIVGATLAADVTRYSRSGGQAMVSSGLTLGLGFFVFVMLGAIAVKGTGTGDLISIIVNSGLGLLGALLLLVSSWTSADNNVYSAGLALSKVFNLPKYFFTIATVVIGGILAATGIYSNLMTYLTIISLLIPPIGGIVAVDYFLVRKRLNVAPAEEMTAPIIRNYNRKALIAWLVAIATDYVTALQLNIGASGLNGLVIGVVVYYLLTRGREARTSEEQQTFPIRERE